MGRLDAVLDRVGLRRAPGLPTQVHLSVTDRCFLPCMHCDIWRNRTEDLPGSAWIEVIDRLAEWAGPCAVNFAGGEPLLRRDLEELMAHASSLGHTVSFNTNGWLLDRERVRRISEAGVSIAYLSLDGARRETVDRTRGREGAWDRCMRALELLDQHSSPRVVIAAILHGRNAAEIPELLEMVRRRGWQLVVQPLYQDFGHNVYDPTWTRRSSLWPSELSEVNRAIDVLVAERRRGGAVCNAADQLEAMRGYYAQPERFNGLTCRAGHSDLAFDAQGGIRLCYFLDPVGTIADPLPLAALWDSPRTLRRRWQVSRCERSCNLLNCNFDRDDP